MDTFAFIIHPIDPKRDISRKYPLLGKIATQWMIDNISPLWPPVLVSEIDGITSASSGKEIKGWFVACPLTPAHILQLPEKAVYRKIIETGHLAEKLGANILGLGAFTSVVGDAGQTIARALEVPVTTGDSYTVAVAVQAVLSAAEMLGIRLEHANVAVVGATGAIGSVCAELMAESAAGLILIGRRQAALEDLRQKIMLERPERSGSLHVTTNTDLSALREAQLILTVTSAVHDIIEPDFLRPGSVVCDVARPRNISAQIAAARDDVLVIDGGMVDVPGPVDFHFDFGFPAGKAFACMAETIALALEGRFEDYTLGKELSRDRVKEITAMAEKHGFRLSGFRSFEKPVLEDTIERVRKKALANLL
jgi:fatty aldehyde-generating acyl-ACP reductase